jgi:hypothetical protein
VWSLPQADGRGDFAATNALAERSHELHGGVRLSHVKVRIDQLTWRTSRLRSRHGRSRARNE